MRVETGVAGEGYRMFRRIVVVAAFVHPLQGVKRPKFSRHVCRPIFGSNGASSGSPGFRRNGEEPVGDSFRQSAPLEQEGLTYNALGNLDQMSFSAW